MRTLAALLTVVLMLPAAGQFSNRRAPGFSLADYGPPSLTPEVTLALIWSSVCRAAVVEPPALAEAGLAWIAGGRRSERAEPHWRRAVSLICAGLAIRMTVLCVGSGAALTASVAPSEGCS